VISGTLGDRQITAPAPSGEARLFSVLFSSPSPNVRQNPNNSQTTPGEETHKILETLDHLVETYPMFGLLLSRLALHFRQRLTLWRLQCSLGAPFVGLFRILRSALTKTVQTCCVPCTATVTEVTAQSAGRMRAYCCRLHRLRTAREKDDARYWRA
jgi:hypothetical protein